MFSTRQADIEATRSFFSSFCSEGFTLDSTVYDKIQNWEILHCNSLSDHGRIVKFIEDKGKKVLTVSLDDKNIFSLKDNFYISLEAERISKNSSLYLFPSYHPIGSSIDGWYPYIPFRYRTGFYRLDLQTGDFGAILNPNSFSGSDYSYALSPNEKYLIFSNRQEKNVFYLRDMITSIDKEFQLDIDIENIGDFVWTPDGANVVFVAGYKGWADNKAGTSLYIFNLQTSQINVLLDKDQQQRMPYPYESKEYWLRENILNLVSAQYNGYWVEWAFNIDTHNIDFAPTQTPRP